LIDINTHKDTLFGIRADLLICLFLGLITLATYWQVVNHEFINYDDPVYVSKNPHIQSGLTLKSIACSFTAEVAGNWHPLTLLSHMLDCQIYGLNPGMHHLNSLLFHIANTLLLFLVLRRMTDALWQSAFVAAMFALHPLHVESVAWVSERKDVLSAFFWILTMWGYIRYVERPGVNRYLLVVLFFILGLMAKPMLVSLPFVLLLLDYWPLKRFQFGQSGGGRLVLEKLPLLAFSAASCVATYFVQQSGGLVRSLSTYPLTVRTGNALVSYINYTAKMIWPYNLSMLYPHPLTLPWWKVVGACLLLISVSLLVILAVKRRPYLAVGWLWYIGTLVPVIGFIQVGVQAMADRYTYMPLIGLLIMIAWGVPGVVKGWRYRHMLFATTVAALLAILTASTYVQIRYWSNSITLFEHALHVTDKNYVINKMLGATLADQGRMTEAIRHYSEALRINPHYVEAHNNLGVVLANQGRMTEAIRHYSEALRICPTYVKAHYNLGVVLANQGKTEKAIKHYSMALQIDPGDAKLHNNLAIALENQGRMTEAIRHFSDALRINPRYVKAHYNLGVILTKLGRTTDAITRFSDALHINPEYAEAHYNLGLSLANQGKMDEAINHFSEALRINPGFVEAHKNLEKALALRGRSEN